MSHSLSDPERGWDKALTDKDIVALSLCVKTGGRPIDWQASGLIQFASVSELRRAFSEKRVLLTKPKGAEEGFELRVTWPCTVARTDGVVSDVSPLRIQFKRKADSRTITLALTKGSVALQPLVQVGQQVYAGQIIASVVPVSASVVCSPVTEAKSAFLQMLASAAVADRYTGAKALSHLQAFDIAEALRGRMNDDREHIYVRLEAAAGLARADQSAGRNFIHRMLQDQYLEHRLEAVIILGELRSAESARTLTSVLLDVSQHPEIRAGAAWALGELKQPSSIDALIQVFLELAEPIRIEAARALRKIGANTVPTLAAKLPDAQDDQRAGICCEPLRLGQSRRVASTDGG